jgi:hypothetical protein
MVDRRNGKDRRVNKDRRNYYISSYNGIENRGAKQQRGNTDRREINNNFFMKGILSQDHGGRRLGIDQRHFIYSGIIPERRSGKDRRSSANRSTD